MDLFAGGANLEGHIHPTPSVGKHLLQHLVRRLSASPGVGQDIGQFSNIATQGGQKGFLLRGRFLEQGVAFDVVAVDKG